MKDICWIYVGRCLTTNKVYVGQTTKGKRRVFLHKGLLEKGQHANSYLQRAWVKYGSADFTWIAVEECTEDTLTEREQWWISFLRADDRRYGFNLCSAIEGSSPNRTHLSLSQIETWKDPEIRGKRLEGLRTLHKDQEWKSQRSKDMAARWQDPEWRAKMTKILANNVETMQDRMVNEPEFKETRLRGIKQYQVPKAQRPPTKR